MTSSANFRRSWTRKVFTWCTAWLKRPRVTVTSLSTSNHPGGFKNASAFTGHKFGKTWLWAPTVPKLFSNSSDKPREQLNFMVVPTNFWSNATVTFVGSVLTLLLYFFTFITLRWKVPSRYHERIGERRRGMLVAMRERRLQIFMRWTNWQVSDGKHGHLRKIAGCSMLVSRLSVIWWRWFHLSRKAGEMTRCIIKVSHGSGIQYCR